MRVNVRCEDKSEVVDNVELQDRSGRGKESESDRGRRLGGRGEGVAVSKRSWIRGSR
jgi:hypothetical protein